MPLCGVHHRELHRKGDERAWWKQLNIDPLPIALRFWRQTGACPWGRVPSPSHDQITDALIEQPSESAPPSSDDLPSGSAITDQAAIPMISLQRLEANRRNALRSTGPKTEDGKQRSRANAVRHGLTAETVVGSLEDAEDYKAFEAAITRTMRRNGGSA